METRNAELRTSAREEERRRRDEAVAVGLQQQLDELRQMLREHVGRYQRMEEQLRQSESQLGQVRVELTEARQEVNRLTQVRQLEDQRLRQQLAELQARAEEPMRPLRGVQSQVAELHELLRLQREQTGQEERYRESMRAQIEGFHADVIRTQEAARQTRDALDSIVQTISVHAREVQRHGDQTRLLEQDLRRRIGELQEQITFLSSRIDEVAGHRPQLEAAIEDLRDRLATFQPQVDLLSAKDEQLAQQISRVQVQADDGDAHLRERLEAVRTQLTTELGSMSAASDEAIESIHLRVAEWERNHRDVLNRLSSMVVQITTLQQEDDQLAEMVRRSEERLLLQRLEQAQQAWEELMERRQRESEGS